MIKSYYLAFDVPKVVARQKDALRTGMEEISRAIIEDARDRVSVKTGDLHDSLTQLIGEDGMEAVVGTPVRYAIYQEYGTRKHPPAPFMRPAIDKIANMVESFFRL